ncbi:MAG TPA: multiheme c-type cytochrome [Gemmataceae bacterium]|nr:multiheme c-type cytochrome [Gemmataceae bacterium]
MRYGNRQTPVLPEQSFPIPPFTKSAFLNTGPDAHYVGIETCKSCHAERYESYLLTPHSRALADVDAKMEPPDARFEHKASGRSFRVYRQGDQFRHEEWLRTADGREIGRIDLPVRYRIGSGNFTRSFLVEVDGFLHESPLTWYTSRQSWDLSPGYDFPMHASFERPVTIGCLSCHSGRADAQDGAVHRFAIREHSIGCESCHGPGSLHVDYYRAGNRTAAEDRTIVNPGKISRTEQESVCAACHLNSVATVYLRGRGVHDFRPGMALSDVRVDYRFDSGTERMKVVGHIEQLRRSFCYQKSNDLSCLTCHDPHAGAKPKDSVAFYRQKCLNCHSLEACRLAPAERRKRDSQDNCMACHMPRGNTDIPHVAFTHHRIGRHAETPEPVSQRVPELVPIGDVSRLSELDQKRNLGLAYLSLLTSSDTQPAQAVTFRQRARELLQFVDKSNLRDGPTAAGLAALAWNDKDFPAAAAFARKALETNDLRAEEHADVLLIQANCSIQEKRYDRAIETLTELIKLRRYSGDWRLLGMCYLEQADLPKALAAFRQALAIRPWRADVHLGLEQVYRRMGDERSAAQEHELAQWLTEHGQR